MSTAQDNRNQVVLSAQELHSHYRFRLSQAGFSPHRAASLATLMLEIPTNLAPAEQALVEQAITALEQRKISEATQAHRASQAQRAPRATKPPRYTTARSKSPRPETHLRPISPVMDSAS